MMHINTYRLCDIFHVAARVAASNLLITLTALGVLSQPFSFTFRCLCCVMPLIDCILVLNQAFLY